MGVEVEDLVGIEYRAEVNLADLVIVSAAVLHDPCNVFIDDGTFVEVEAACLFGVDKHNDSMERDWDDFVVMLQQYMSEWKRQ